MCLEQCRWRFLVFQLVKCGICCFACTGSFNAGHEILTDKNPHAKDLFEAEQSDLLDDLYEIPQRSCDRKVINLGCTVLSGKSIETKASVPSTYSSRLSRKHIVFLYDQQIYVLSVLPASQVNEFVKRVRACKIHILVIGHLRKQLPSVFGKKSAYYKVLDNMHEHFDSVSSLMPN